MQHLARCLLCDQAPETMHPLMLACPFSRQIWYDTVMAENAMPSFRRRSVAPRLVDRREAGHPHADAQGTYLRNSAGTVDALEAPK